MNGYDFDKTIFDGDCLIRFYFYTLFLRPFLFLIFPFHLFVYFLRSINVVSKKRTKEIMMFNLRFFRDRNKLVERFWAKNIKRIKQWYLEQKKENDVIISASPEFLVRYACEKINLKNIIASRLKIDTLKMEGHNCFGKEKAIRFEKEFGKDYILDEFYSDSLSDMPMFKKAKKAILVKGNKRINLQTENI